MGEYTIQVIKKVVANISVFTDEIEDGQTAEEVAITFADFGEGEWETVPNSYETFIIDYNQGE